MKIRHLILTLITFAIMTQLAMQGVQAQNTTTITIVPEQTEKLSVGETFTVNVVVENCVEVYAVQVDIHYDPNILEAINILEGPFMPSFGQTLLALNESYVKYDEDAEVVYGRIRYVVSLTGDNPGASGGGVLFSVTFKVVSDGSSALQLIEYPGSGVDIGTYFARIDPNSPMPDRPRIIEIIPERYDAYYGERPTNVIPPQSSEIKVEKAEPISNITLLAMLCTILAMIFMKKRMHNGT